MLPRKYGKMQLQEARMVSKMAFFNRTKPEVQREIKKVVIKKSKSTK